MNLIFFCASAAGAAGEDDGEDYGEGGVLACGAAEVEVQWGMFGMVTEPKKA